MPHSSDSFFAPLTHRTESPISFYLQVLFLGAKPI